MALKNTAQVASNITNKAGEKVAILIDSNISEINLVDQEFTVVKTTAKDWALPKDEIEVTTTITNNLGSVVADLEIIDTLSDNAQFVEGSFKIGSIAHEDINPLELTTLQVTLDAGMDMTYSYKIKVNDLLENYTVTNSSDVGFNYAGQKFNIVSNTAEIDVLNNQLFALKTAQPTAVVSKDTIEYTIVVSNNGELTNTDIVFKDVIPEGLTFVAGSITVDDESKPDYDLSGFSLKDLAKGESTTVKFKCTVD